MTVTVPDPDRLAEAQSIATMLQGVLDRVVDGYAQAGVDLPARRFWMTGTPAHDCEQLVVVFRQAYIGPPGDEASDPQRCDGPRSAAIEVHVTRCIPSPKGTRATAPKAEDIQAGAAKQVVDAWLLLDLAPATEQWGFPGGPGLGVIATVEAGEPQGAFQSTVLNLTMAIP